MRDGVTALQLGSEFDAFLFAPIDREETGMVLSVASALARLDLDPWREAAELTRMSRSAANQRLTSLIAALPGATSLPSAAASRLIDLLPRGESFVAAACVKVLGTNTAAEAQNVVRVLVINLVLLAGVLFGQWAFTRLNPPADAQAIPASASSIATPPPTPTHG